jgi:hypothetical protein
MAPVPCNHADDLETHGVGMAKLFAEPILMNAIVRNLGKSNCTKPVTCNHAYETETHGVGMARLFDAEV